MKFQPAGPRGMKIYVIIWEVLCCGNLNWGNFVFFEFGGILYWWGIMCALCMGAFVPGDDVCFVLGDFVLGDYV